MKRAPTERPARRYRTTAEELLSICATALFDAEWCLRRAVEDSPEWKQAALECAERIEPIARAIISTIPDPITEKEREA